MSTVLEFSDVDVKRGHKYLLKNINWSVDETDRWVIVGPNGAGKTTLIQLAAARMHPTKGEVKILEETMGRVDVFELRPRIGLSSSSLNPLIPELEKVINVVVTAGYGVTGRWREEYDKMDLRRAYDLLDEWGMGALMNRKYGTLSAGERKRTQIARALMTDPELMLLDEPGGGLDLAGREDLIKKLTELATDEYGPTTIVVTHHLEEIPPGFTHALLLKDAEIVAAGPIKETLTEENLSKTYERDLVVTERDGRYTAVAR